MSPTQTTREIMFLFAEYGAEDYDGEPVSQAAHMIQCGMLAEEESGDPELIVGAFLHDIGHLLKHTQATTAMGAFGVVNHEVLGAGFLREHGFSERVCAVVAGHVAAKRYLVATDPEYKARLSEASLYTLEWQGGPMNETEITAFEQDPFFRDIVQVRIWDEASKDPDLALRPSEYFEGLITQHLILQHQAYEAID